MARVVINSIKDLRSAVEDRLGPDSNERIRDEVAASLQFHPCRPLYGDDWASFLSTIDLLGLAEEADKKWRKKGR